MDNYEFCAQWAARQGGKVLDYGCGRGELVGLMRSRGLDAFGCDRYYEGNDWSGDVPLPLRPYVLKMPTDRIPFEDASFDCVISNQVLEHVPDLESVAAELQRVMKPGGVALHLFPGKDVWLEAHVKLPFVHWLTGRPQELYASVLSRSASRGLARCAYLRSWTHYRTPADIHRALGTVHHIEDEWLDTRRKLPLPRAVKRWIVRKRAGFVIEVRHKD